MDPLLTKLEFPQELSKVHNTFHVSNLKKCYADEPLAVLLDGLHLDDKLHFVEEPLEIVGREVKRLKRSRIPLVKVRWNSKRGPEFTWEREDQFKKKYPHLFTKTTPSSSAASIGVGINHFARFKEDNSRFRDFRKDRFSENGNSFKSAAQTTTNAEDTSTTLIPGLVTADEKIQKKNDVKARGMLLMALLNEHLLTFNQYKDAKTLLQKNVSQLAILAENISQEDLNLNVLRKVKRTTSSSSSSQNMAFVSSPSSTNEVNTAYGVSTANTQVSPASTQVCTASTQITINGSDTAGYAKSKVESFNCHKMGHFARECRGPRNQDSKNRNQDSFRRNVNVEETSSKAMVAINGAGFNRSYMADDEVPINMALMAFLDSEITGKSKKGVGFVSYNVVPSPHKGLFSPLNLDLSYSGLEEFQQPKFEGYGPKTSKSVSEDISNEVRESSDAPLVEELVSDDKLEALYTLIDSPTVAKIEIVRPKQQEKPCLGNQFKVI
ncbi:ribonuclease H-like domain-containing protein [Tanacetum coccineum]